MFKKPCPRENMEDEWAEGKNGAGGPIRRLAGMKAVIERPSHLESGCGQ